MAASRLTQQRVSLATNPTLMSDEWTDRRTSYVKDDAILIRRISFCEFPEPRLWCGYVVLFALMFSCGGNDPMNHTAHEVKQSK
jgi:hypothetical protein